MQGAVKSVNLTPIATTPVPHNRSSAPTHQDLNVRLLRSVILDNEASSISLKERKHL